MFKILDSYMQSSGLRNGLNPYLYRIYKNPEARNIYLRSQWADSFEERKYILKKMGEYTLVDETPKFIDEVKNSFKIAINDLKEWYLPQKTKKK